MERTGGTVDEQYAQKELELFEYICELVDLAREAGWRRSRFVRQLRRLHRQSMKESVFGTMNKNRMRAVLDSMLETAWPR